MAGEVRGRANIPALAAQPPAPAPAAAQRAPSGSGAEPSGASGREFGTAWESSSVPEEVWERHSMGWGSRDAQLTSGSPEFQIHPFPCVDKKHQKLSHYSKTKPCAQLGAPLSVLGGEFCSSAAHPGLRRERGSLVFTEAEGLLGRALSKQLRASPARSSLEQREPSLTGRGDKEPPKRFPQGHLWHGRSWGDTQTDPRGLVVGSGPPCRGQAGTRRGPGSPW